jgi:hypothetical protein
VIEHLNCKEDYDCDESQDRQTGNQQAQASLTPLRPSWAAWALREQVFSVPRILQDIRGIERASSRGCTVDPFLALTFLLGLSQLRGFLDLALQFFHLATQLFFLFRKLVLFRRYRRIVKSSTSHHSTISAMHEVENQQRT